MEHKAIVDEGSVGAIREGRKTAYTFQRQVGYATGDTVIFSAGHAVAVKVESILRHTLAEMSDKDAQAQGFEDLNAFAVAWDAEKRNREASKKFENNPVVHTVRFSLVKDLGVVANPPAPAPTRKPFQAPNPKNQKKPAAKVANGAKGKKK